MNSDPNQTAEPPEQVAEKLAVPLAGAYLDTSAIRAYSSGDTWLKDASAHTSILTAIELLDGSTASQYEYMRRRAAFRKITSMGVVLSSPYLPLLTVMRAFPYVHDLLEISTVDFETVAKLIDVMLQTESAAEFDVYLRRNEQWVTIQANFANFAKQVVGDFGSQSKALRDQFARASAAELAKLGLEANQSTRERMASFVHNPLNRACSLLALAYSVAIAIGRDDESTQRAIYDSFNQLALPYVDAISVSFTERISRGELPQENDVYDQFHFAYLEPRVLLASNDQRMRALASKIGLTAVDANEFRRLAQISIAERNAERSGTET